MLKDLSRQEEEETEDWHTQQLEFTMADGMRVLLDFGDRFFGSEQYQAQNVEASKMVHGWQERAHKNALKWMGIDEAQEMSPAEKPQHEHDATLAIANQSADPMAALNKHEADATAGLQDCFEVRLKCINDRVVNRYQTNLNLFVEKGDNCLSKVAQVLTQVFRIHHAVHLEGLDDE